MEKLLFKEEQRFTQWWMWLILGSALLAIVIPIVNEFSAQSWNTSSEGSSRLILYGSVAVLFIVAVLIVLVLSRLKTKITYDGIFISFPPLINKWKRTDKSEIAYYEVRKYKPVLEYGGWGIKAGRRKSGAAYNVSGNIGLQLYLKNGKKLLLGTQKKQAIKHAMEKLFVDQKVLNKPVLLATKENKIQLGSKTKKFLMIVLIEIVLGIIIFSLIQVFK